jgi:hypothetical protein
MQRSVGTRLAALGAAGALLLLAGPAPAVDVEKLVMPGPVIAGHAKVEGECSRCHQPFQSEAEKSLCLDCHEDVQADLRDGAGFHGKSPAVSGASCRSCHTEHKGRKADILGLDRESFDHHHSDFELRGAHTRLACEACHTSGEKYREAPSECSTCHGEDDVHKGRLGSDCAKCHGVDSWKQGRFDHSKTRFPLEQGHADVACALCHPNQRYEKTPLDCRSCHGLDDAHRGRFGQRCATCHTTRDWRSARFDHDRETHFPLRGAHAKARCEACHKGVLHEEKLATDCYSCHRLDDDHRGRNGRECARCHDTSSWKKSDFDHDRDTDFPLRGAHARTDCEQCHRGAVFEEELSTTCIDCHRRDDAHAGQEGRDCARCHRESGWRDQVFFDHELVRFPLLGLHATVPCEECHASPRFRDASEKCADCHRDEFHGGRLGKDCASCHNPNGWRFWDFDHDARTSFPLHGAHEGLDCHACHRQPVSGDVPRLSGRCYACHADDDAHSGFFGRDCARCHGESSWSDAKVGRQ